VTVEHRHLGR